MISQEKTLLRRELQFWNRYSDTKLACGKALDPMQDKNQARTLALDLFQTMTSAKRPLLRRFRAIAVPWMWMKGFAMFESMHPQVSVRLGHSNGCTASLETVRTGAFHTAINHQQTCPTTSKYPARECQHVQARPPFNTFTIIPKPRNPTVFCGAIVQSSLGVLGAIRQHTMSVN